MQKKLILITLLLIFTLISLGAVSAESLDNVTVANSPETIDDNITQKTSTHLPDPEVWRGGVLVYSTTISIQDAMDHSMSGDTIKLEEGQTFYENLVIDKDLTFEVMNGGTATIDGSGTDRVIHILPGITAYFYNITFQNGHAPDGSLLSPDGKNGGGIWNEGTLYLINCIVKDNRAGDGGSITYGGIGGSGGGIYSTGTLELTDTQVYNNRAGDGSNGIALTHSDGFHGGHGGGIYSTGALTINNSELYNNQAGNGGKGVVLGEGGNGGNGGAIYTTGTLTMSNTQIYENYAGNAGSGGINIIIGGTGGAGGNGGAIYNTGNANVECSEIYSNTAGDGGTGASAADGNLLNPTGYNGHHGGPGGNGGAIFNQGSLTLSETEIYSNKAGNGGTGGAAGDGRDRSLTGAGGPGGIGGTGGPGGNGAAIYNTGSDTLTVTDCNITQNTAGIGGVGGVGGQGGDARSSIPFRGTAYTGGAGGLGGPGGNGGAIYYNNGNGAINDSNFTDNRAGNGGDGGIGGQGGASASTYTNGNGGPGGNAGNGGNGGAIYYKTGSLTVESNNLIHNQFGDGGIGGDGGQAGPGTGSGTIGTDGTDGSSGTGGAFYAANNTALHFNRILSNGAVDVVAAGGATVQAENNWWGSNDNPSSRVSTGVIYSPWIMLQIFANPGTIHYLNTSNITADLTWNTFDGVTPNAQPGGNHITNNTPVTFSTNLGIINPVNTETTGGTANSTFTGTVVGMATVSAQVDNEIQSTSVTVDKADTVITVSNATGVYLGSVDLFATLVDVYGNPLSGLSVDFFVDGNLVGSATTDGSGQASFTYSPIIENPAGNPHTITANFTGNESYNPASGTNNLTVNKANTTITVSNATGVYLGSVDLFATLVDVYGNPLSGLQVDFFVDGNLVGSATTDGSGQASFTYSPIIENPAGNPHTITANFTGNESYNPASGTNNLTVNKANTTITVDNATENKGKTVNLIATLKDQYGNLLAGRTVNFLVNGVNAGSAVTDINGIATKSYFINLIGGTYNIQVDFLGDDYYLTSNGTGTLKVPQSDLYVKIWASNNKPHVGDSITITFKVGNRGVDTAQNVVLTMKIPKGMEFVKANVDVGTFTYNKATGVITWNIGNVPVGDPYLYLVVKVLKSGKFVFKPHLSTETYDPNLVDNTGILVVNAQSSNNNHHKIPMQHTGIPIGALLIAILAVFGGLIMPFKK